MKYFIQSIIFWFAFSSPVWAMDKAKIQGVGVPACISVSTTSWTAIPSTTTIKGGRTGIFLMNSEANTGTFNISFTSSPLQSPAVSTNTASVQLAKSYTTYIEISQFIYVFALSRHTAAEDICYQEVTAEQGR